ncbi:uncharacterized protein LOC110110672 isoform X5 [Dendrobium catenatum]|uniref:uncharacterized protein LOC110110672 isoform X5 n=1 Tax=Dendrobium catenatum TaxID=906689 RepID=UPI0010A08559|nr:uncharacterized protein LOC110110672 isoform X5 [Dendrobium catenatum]
MSNNFLFYHCSNKGRGSSFHHPVCLWTSKIKLKLGALECSLKVICVNLVAALECSLRHPFSDSVKQDASSDGLYESNIHSGVSNGVEERKSKLTGMNHHHMQICLQQMMLHNDARATEGNKTKTPCPGAQSALRATTHSGMKIGRISQQLARIWGQVE